MQTDQIPCSAASDMSLHCLLKPHSPNTLVNAVMLAFTYMMALPPEANYVSILGRQLPIFKSCLPLQNGANIFRYINLFEELESQMTLSSCIV